MKTKSQTLAAIVTSTIVCTTQAALIFSPGDSTLDAGGVPHNAASFLGTEQEWHYAGSTGGSGSSTILDLQGGQFIHIGGNNIRSIGYFFDDNMETTGTVTLSFQYSSTDVNGEIGVVWFGTNSIGSETFDFGWNTSETIANGLSNDMGGSDSHYVGGTILPGTFFQFTPGNVGTSTFSETFDLGSTPFETIGFVIAERNFATGTLSFDNFSVVIPEPTSITLLALGLIGFVTIRRRK